MTDTTELGPITNQEILAAADRIAHDLVTYALAEIRDLLGDGIAETIADDKVADRLDRQARGIVYGLVWDRLAQAGADYQRRDQILTEAAARQRAIARRLDEYGLTAAEPLLVALADAIDPTVQGLFVPARVRDAASDLLRAEAAEPLRVRLWLIGQYVARITADDDPVGIALDLTPWLDGPIHRDHIAAYRAAQEN